MNYDRTDQPTFEDRTENDWQMVGTIHSHCDFSAFHSGTDTGDEASFDGIHITLGHVNRNQFSMVSTIAINDNRESLQPENCCSGVVQVVQKENKHPYMTWGTRDSFYDLELSEEDSQNLLGDIEEIETVWMPKVEHHQPVYSGRGMGFHTNWTGGTYSGTNSDSKKNGSGNLDGLDELWASGDERWKDFID